MLKCPLSTFRMKTRTLWSRSKTKEERAVALSSIWLAQEPVYTYSVIYNTEESAPVIYNTDESAPVYFSQRLNHPALSPIRRKFMGGLIGSVVAALSTAFEFTMFVDPSRRNCSFDSHVFEC